MVVVIFVTLLMLGLQWWRWRWWWWWYLYKMFLHFKPFEAMVLFLLVCFWVCFFLRATLRAFLPIHSVKLLLGLWWWWWWWWWWWRYLCQNVFVLQPFRSDDFFLTCNIENIPTYPLSVACVGFVVVEMAAVVVVVVLVVVVLDVGW